MASGCASLKSCGCPRAPPVVSARAGHVPPGASLRGVPGRVRPAGGARVVLTPPRLQAQDRGARSDAAAVLGGKVFRSVAAPRPLPRPRAARVYAEGTETRSGDVGGRRALGVVITGGTKGFGYALALELLRAGDRVMICGRSLDRTTKAVEAMQAAVPGAEVYGVKCDVSCPVDVANLAKSAKAELGTVDRWVNNAAHISEPKPLFEVDPLDLAAVVGTNVYGSLLCCREAINLMRAQPEGGASTPVYQIFNFGFSPWGAALSSAVCTHKATKKGLAQLNTSLADELKKAGIQSIGVQNLSPGMVLTDLLLKGSNPVSRRIFNALAEEPETIAAALAPKVRAATGATGSIEYLTLPDAVKRMVTGVPQIVNGGRFFDKQGNRVTQPGANYKANGVRLLYPDAAREETSSTQEYEI